MPDSHRLGKEGEELACSYLKKRGYAIIERNWRSFSGEIDIVAFEPERKILVFVEVKRRSSSSFLSSPIEAVDRKKVERLKKTALLYLSQNQDLEYEEIRFDVIGINGKEIVHYEDAF